MSDHMFQPATTAPTATDTQQPYQHRLPFSPSRYRDTIINAEMQPTPFGCSERWRTTTRGASPPNIAQPTPHVYPPMLNGFQPRGTATPVIQISPPNETRELSITQCTTELDSNMAGLDADFARLEYIVQHNRQALAKTLEEQRKRRQGITPAAGGRARNEKAPRKQGWLETESGIMRLSAQGEAPSPTPMGPYGRYGSGAIRKRGQKQAPFSQRRSGGGPGNTNVATSFHFGRGRGVPPSKKQGSADQSSIELCEEAMMSFQFAETDESYLPPLPPMPMYDDEFDMVDLPDVSPSSEGHSGILHGRLGLGGPPSAQADTLKAPVMADTELLTGIESLRLNNSEKSPIMMEHKQRVLQGARVFGMGWF